MATTTLGGKDIEIDEDGFIQDPEQWDDEVAKDLAKTEGVDDMTDEHWHLVRQRWPSPSSGLPGPGSVKPFPIQHPACLILDSEYSTSGHREPEQ